MGHCLVQDYFITKFVYKPYGNRAIKENNNKNNKNLKKLSTITIGVSAVRPKPLKMILYKYYTNFQKDRFLQHLMDSETQLCSTNKGLQGATAHEAATTRNTGANPFSFR